MSTETPMPTDTEPQPTAVPRPWWRKRATIITAAAVVVVAAAAGAWAATSSSPAKAPATTAAAPAPAGTAIDGTLSVLVPYFLDQTSGSNGITGTLTQGDDCTGSGQYADVATGLTIAVTGASGQTLAQIPLAAGVVGNDPTTGISACIFDFDATVPADAGTYTVTVGSYTSKTYTLSQLGDLAIYLQD